MCDQPCSECKQCTQPRICTVCGSGSENMIECVCGCFVCPEHDTKCHGCGESIHGGCAHWDADGNLYCDTDCRDEMKAVKEI